MQRSVFNCGEESRRRWAHSAWNQLCFSSAMDRHQVLLWLLASWHQPHWDLQCETHFHVQHLLPLSGDHLIKEWRALTSLQCCNIPFISISFWEFVFSKFAIYGGAELFWIFLMFWYICEFKTRIFVFDFLIVCGYDNSFYLIPGLLDAFLL